MAGTRSPVTGSSFFNLDGVKCGFVKSVDGGGIRADVIEEPSEKTFYVKKHIGQPKYEEFTLQIGFSMAQVVYDWIAASWNENYSRKDGSIVAADMNMNAKSEREFFHALLTEVGFPALDASSKDAGYLTLKFAPEYTKTAKASGKLTPGKAVQKQFVASGFQLELDGLDCTHVNRIEPFAVKQPMPADDIGEGRDILKEPGKLDFPDLTITLSEVTAQTWLDWFDDFVLKGNNADAKEKEGAVVFLSPNRQVELGRVILHNVGIFALRHHTATGEAIARVTAELYCERMELQVGKPAPKPVPPRPMPIVRKPTPLPR